MANGKARGNSASAKGRGSDKRELKRAVNCTVEAMEQRVMLAVTVHVAPWIEQGPGTITGPNTGGKTVALKAAGLLSLMAQAGLYVPAADARLPVFRSVFADIGDEQSIAANLSTFSWHVTNISAMDRSLALPALVLLDEVGAGTDPLEGGALGVAIIEHFRSRGAVVISTTHYEALKTYAATTSLLISTVLSGSRYKLAPLPELP